MEKLREKKILVRWFNYPETKDYLRITIGTDAEIAALLKAIRKVLSESAGNYCSAEIT